MVLDAIITIVSQPRSKIRGHKKEAFRNSIFQQQQWIYLITKNITHARWQYKFLFLIILEEILNSMTDLISKLCIVYRSEATLTDFISYAKAIGSFG